MYPVFSIATTHLVLINETIEPTKDSQMETILFTETGNFSVTHIDTNSRCDINLTCWPMCSTHGRPEYIKRVTQFMWHNRDIFLSLTVILYHCYLGDKCYASSDMADDRSDNWFANIVLNLITSYLCELCKVITCYQINY